MKKNTIKKNNHSNLTPPEGGQSPPQGGDRPQRPGGEQKNNDLKKELKK